MFQGACHKRALGGMLVALFAAGIAITITAQSSSNTITACVNSAGLVRITPPRTGCFGSEQPIQWNITGPAGSDGSMGPRGPAGPAGPQGPPGEGGGAMNVPVNCGAGETVNAALAQGTDRSGRLFISIHGVCHESVTINRDDVILMGGGAPDDGLAVPTASSYPLGVAGGQRVELRQLTLQGGGYGLLVSQGAAVTGAGLRITGARWA